MHGWVGVGEGDLLADHGRGHVRDEAAALLVNRYGCERRGVKAIAQAVLDVDENIGQLAAGDYVLLAHVRACKRAGRVLRHVDLDRRRHLFRQVDGAGDGGAVHQVDLLIARGRSGNQRLFATCEERENAPGGCCNRSRSHVLVIPGRLSREGRAREGAPPETSGDLLKELYCTQQRVVDPPGSREYHDGPRERY